MSTRSRRWTRVGNRVGVRMYRILGGRLASGKKGVHVLMVTTPGRRTGIPRSTCVRYLDTAEGYLVRELVGAERDAAWTDVVLARAPEVERYARRAGRVIPVAVLSPLPDGHGG